MIDRTATRDGPPPATPACGVWVLGLDLGQAQDFTALSLIEPTGEPTAPTYDVRRIERLALNTPYPAIVSYTCEVVAALGTIAPKRPIHLALDFTGCGRPVADMFAVAADKGKLDAKLVFITITGADAVTQGESGDWRVPKRDLASIIQILLQSSRLRFAQGLPIAETLKQELTGFRAKTKLNGHQTFEAGDDWRSAPHDDLVLSLACGLWRAERLIRNRPPSVVPVGIGRTRIMDGGLDLSQPWR